MIRSQEMMAQIQAVSEKNAILMQEIAAMRHMLEQKNRRADQSGPGQGQQGQGDMGQQAQDGRQGREQRAVREQGAGQGQDQQGGAQGQDSRQGQGQEQDAVQSQGQEQGQEQDAMQSQGQGQGQAQGRGRNRQGQGQGANRGGGQAAGQGQNQPQGQGQNQPAGSYMSVASLAGDFLQLKTMILALEAKTSNFVSSQAGGGLTDKDVVNLVLMLMDGMVNWASDYVTGAIGQTAAPQASAGQISNDAGASQVQ